MSIAATVGLPIVTGIPACIHDGFVALERLIAKKQAIKQGTMQQLLTGKTRLPGFTENWNDAKLGEVLEFQVGFPFRSSGFSKLALGPRLIRNRDLKSKDSILYYCGHYSRDYVVINGDLLIGMDGDFTPCRWSSDLALLNQRVGRILTGQHVDLEFLLYALMGPLKEIESGTGATTVKHLSHGDIEGLVMSLPSADEQRAIAAVLSDIDAEIDALRRRLEKAKATKQGMMQELLTGRTRLSVKEAVE